MKRYVIPVLLLLAVFTATFIVISGHTNTEDRKIQGTLENETPIKAQDTIKPTEEPPSSEEMKNKTTEAEQEKIEEKTMRIVQEYTESALAKSKKIYKKKYESTKAIDKAITSIDKSMEPLNSYLEEEYTSSAKKNISAIMNYKKTLLQLRDCMTEVSAVLDQDNNSISKTKLDDAEEAVMDLEAQRPKETAILLQQIKKAQYGDGMIYNSDTLSIKIEQKDTVDCIYWLCHILTSSPDQLKACLANGAYAAGRQTTSEQTKANDGILGINGSMFTYDNGTPSPGKIMIRSGQILNDGRTNDNIMAITKEGWMYTSDAGITAADLQSIGVKDTFCFGPTLVENGSEYFIDTSKFNQGNVYPRTVIGMASVGDYYVLVADGKRPSYSKGLTYKEAAQIMLNAGCSYAYNLDGGGSTTLYFNGRVINSPSDGKERACGDALYFTN